MLKATHTVEKLSLPTQSLQFDLLSSQFPHLRGLPVQDYVRAKPTILIGFDTTHLEGRPVSSCEEHSYICVVISGIDSRFSSRDEELLNLVKEFFSIENVGVAVAPLVEDSEEKRPKKFWRTQRYDCLQDDSKQDLCGLL